MVLRWKWERIAHALVARGYSDESVRVWRVVSGEHGREVDVLKEPRDHHLLDLEIGLDEVGQRRVEDEVIEPLVEIGDPLAKAVDAAAQRSEPFFGLGPAFRLMKSP